MEDSVRRKNIIYVLCIAAIIVLLLLIAHISGKSGEIRDLPQTVTADVQTEKLTTAGTEEISYEQKRIEAMKYVPYINVMSAASDVGIEDKSGNDRFWYDDGIISVSVIQTECHTDNDSAAQSLGGAKLEQYICITISSFDKSKVYFRQQYITKSHESLYNDIKVVKEDINGDGAEEYAISYDVPDSIEPNGRTVMLIFNPVSLDLINVFEEYGDIYTEFTSSQSEEIDTRIRELKQKDERLSWYEHFYTTFCAGFSPKIVTDESSVYINVNFGIILESAMTLEKFRAVIRYNEYTGEYDVQDVEYLVD